MVIVGTAGSDSLRGTLTADSISGGGGNDTLLGRSGRDTMDGGSGADQLAGGEGRDILSGGDGDDVIFGYGSTDVDGASANITLTNVGTRSFSNPVFASSAPGDPDRLFVVEQHTGRILILDTDTGTTNARPFLDLPDASLADGSEQGLLGMAFDPDYQTNGRFFVYLTQADGDVELRAYQRSATNPDLAQASSGNTILVIDKDNGAANHNGGWLGFGPDGMLYAGVGDEGGAGDPANNAQNTNSLWGKILRLDVDGDDFAGNANRDYAIPDDNPFAGGAGADEVWAYGLRNPWRNSFDRSTGDLFIGDVGQGQREEIDFQLAGAGGANFGWKVKEGDVVYNDDVPGNPSPDSPILVDPLVAYPHDATGGFAVVGGYVYRGEGAGMQGRYVYADYVSEQLWSFRAVGGVAVDVTNHTAQLVSAGGTIADINSFAEDGRGDLYAVGLGGTISHLTFGTGAGDGADSIGGGAGNDQIHGGAGRDTIDGGAGQDRLFGGGQGDTLRGGSGADALRGGGGNDLLDGGANGDTLTGGGGADTFVFTTSSGADRVADFENNIDTVRLGDDFGFATVNQALEFADQVGDDVVFGFAGGQVLTVADTTIAALNNDLVV